MQKEHKSNYNISSMLGKYCNKETHVLAFIFYTQRASKKLQLTTISLKFYN